MLTLKKVISKEGFIQRLREATDDLQPHFEFNGIPMYVSSKVPENEIWFITPNTHFELKL